MANTALSGKTGLFTYKGGQVANFDTWNMTITNDTIDVTAFSTGEAQWRQFITGLSSWTATASGNYDLSSTGLDNLRTALLTPSTGTGKFEMDQTAGGGLTGDTYITSGSISAPVDGKVEVDFNFQGNGALTYTTAT